MEDMFDIIKDAVLHLLKDAGYDAEVYDNLDVIFNEFTPNKSVVWFAHGDLRFMAQSEFGDRVDMTIMKYISDHTAVQTDESDEELDELDALNDRAVELREELDTIDKQIYDRVAQLTVEDKKQRDAELTVPGSKTWDERGDSIVKDVLNERPESSDVDE